MPRRPRLRATESALAPPPSRMTGGRSPFSISMGPFPPSSVARRTPLTSCGLLSWHPHGHVPPRRGRQGNGGIQRPEKIDGPPSRKPAYQGESVNADEPLGQL